MSIIYRLLDQHSWQQAQASGVFTGSADDARDGFIHFSAPHQVVATARKHYVGKPNLLLLSIDTDALEQHCPGALKWEVSRGGDKFPHLYAALPVAAVQSVQQLPLSAGGEHIFPEL